MRSRPIALVYCILSAFLPSARTTERIEPLADHADDGVEVSFDARNVTRTSGLWGSTMLDLLNPLVRPEDNHYNGPSIYGALHADKRGVWTVGNRASSGLGLRFKINDGGSSTAALFLMKTDMRFETYFDTMNSSLVTISRTDRLETSRIRYVIEENSKFYVSEPSRDFTNDSKASGRSKHSFTIDALKTKWFKFHPARNVELLKQIGEKKVPAFQNIGFVGILLYAKVLRGPVNFGIEKLSISGKSIVSARVENSTVSIPSESLTSAPSDTNISVPTEMPLSLPTNAPLSAPTGAPQTPPSDEPLSLPGFFRLIEGSVDVGTALTSSPSQNVSFDCLGVDHTEWQLVQTRSAASDVALEAFTNPAQDQIAVFATNKNMFSVAVDIEFQDATVFDSKVYRFFSGDENCMLIDSRTNLLEIAPYATLAIIANFDLTTNDLNRDLPVSSESDDLSGATLPLGLSSVPLSGSIRSGTNRPSETSGSRQTSMVLASTLVYMYAIFSFVVV